MLRSMTSFGRRENITDEYETSVEMKTVNHRYLGLGIKIPKKFSYFEALIRALLKKYVQRRKVDLFISYEDYTEGNLCLRYNRALIAECMDYSNRMAEEFDIQNDVKVSTLTKFPEVFSMEQVPDDEGHLWEVLSIALEETVEVFVRSRGAEGEHLKEDLLGKLDYMTGLVDCIEEHPPQILGEYRAKLESKIQDLLGTTVIGGGKTAVKVIIFADRIYVDGKTVRLRSHIGNTRQELLSGESIGRKLGFIAQEINREANTTPSKSTDLSVSDKAIALKTEVEEVREQIQNIEQVDIIRTLKNRGSIPWVIKEHQWLYPGFSVQVREHL